MSSLDFFQNDNDRDHWSAYAAVLGLATPEALLNQYFAGRLVSEFDQIFRDELAPALYDEIVRSLVLSPVGPSEEEPPRDPGVAPDLDFTRIGRYNGGSRRMRVSLAGGAQGRRDALAVEMNLQTNSAAVHGLHVFKLLDLRVERVRMTYQTDHHRGVIVNAALNNDLLDPDPLDHGARFSTRLNQHDKKNPRTEDEFLKAELIDHLNSNIEHYNKVLWNTLDPDRRFMLLDGFHIEVFDANGDPLPARRSLASVVKNELVTVAGNSLVFPVADGFRVTSSRVVEDADPEVARTLMDHYRETDPVPPYRLSVPTRVCTQRR